MQNIQDRLAGKMLKDWRAIAALLLVFAGIDMLVIGSKLPRYVGLLFLVPGTLVLVWLYSEYQPYKKPSTKSYARVIYSFSLRGKLLPYLPLLGLLAILGDVVVNWNSVFGSFDLIIMIFGGLCMVYNYIPGRYHVERDFVFITFFLSIVILVLPMFLYSKVYNVDFTESPLIHYFLGVPLTWILNAIGIEATSKLAVITYELQGGGTAKVGIAAGCAGIYSLGIFVSAFISFVLVEYERFDSRIAGFLFFGVVLAYFANLLRMTIIVAAGSYYGPDALLWTHKHMGEIIFIAWTGLFWWLLFKYMPGPDDSGNQGLSGEHIGSSGGNGRPLEKNEHDVSSGGIGRPFQKNEHDVSSGGNSIQSDGGPEPGKQEKDSDII